MSTRTHEFEVKVRLNEQDYRLVKALADRAGIPVAVMARSWIKSQLARMPLQRAMGRTLNGRPS